MGMFFLHLPYLHFFVVSVFSFELKIASTLFTLDNSSVFETFEVHLSQCQSLLLYGIISSMINIATLDMKEMFTSIAFNYPNTHRNKLLHLPQLVSDVCI